MSDKNDENSPLRAEDQALWDQFVLENLSESENEEENFEALLNEFENPVTEQPLSKKEVEEQNIEPSPSSKKRSTGSEMDRRTEEKLRKGKLRIEARLDLHGKTQSEAYEVLTIFITRALHQQHRCVLIITGKGKSRVSTDSVIEPETGILRQKLPQWLSTEPFRINILRVIPAHIKDGGSGAFYVYLRRQR